jgi:hypothetical protein
MALYTGFYDASGDEHHRESVTVCGVVARADHWPILERNWNAVLAAFGVHHYHGRELFLSLGEFASWTCYPEKARSFLMALIDAAKNSVDFTRTVTAFKDDIDAIDNRFHFKREHGAYALCGSLCVRFCHDWIRTQRPARDPIHFIEEGDAGQDKLMRMLSREGLTGIRFPKKDVVSGVWIEGFQVADLVAGEYRRAHWERLMAGRYIDELRETFQYLRKGLPQHKDYHFERDELMQLCKDNPEDYPPRTT